MIAVTFALPDESSAFLTRLDSPRRHTRGPLQRWTGRLAGRDIAVWHTGIGEKSARRVIDELLAQPHPSLLISAGFAGALDPALTIGDLVLGINVSSSRLASSLAPHHAVPGSFATVDAVADPAAKTALFQSTRAIAVEMETRSLHAACLAASVPILALRVISDAAADPMPVPMDAWFDLDRQRPRPAALLAWLARHPRSIPPFIRFVRGITRARQTLATALAEVIARAPA